MHQVLCTLSNEGSDVRCHICGQGFIVYWSRFSRAEQAETRRVIREYLSSHHNTDFAGGDANHSNGDAHACHPSTGFTVPAWTGSPAFSAAALLSGARPAPFDCTTCTDEVY
jgi:hypothetical protein